MESMVTRPNAKFPHGTDGLKRIGHYKLEGHPPSRKAQLPKTKVLTCRSLGTVAPRRLTEAPLDSNVAW
jgi:hypothetical protein